uniref:Growth hormone secretagogue receptor type 1 n=1 Tax=Nothobranchius furzeri TaxID=105023 RepID=A0A8C6KI02_NOTFU
LHHNPSNAHKMETSLITFFTVSVTVIYIPLMLFGLLGNILTILVVWLRPHMRSSTYLYLSSMAVSDLLILLLLPLDLYKLWRPRPWPLGDLACKLTMFLSECCTFCTILHITFLSLERYLAVCWPITAKTMVTRHRTRVVIGCLWLGAAVSAAPVLVMVGVEDVGIDRRECRCTHYAISSGLLAAMMILSNLYFLVPLCILGLVYSLIGRTLWLRPKSSRRDQSHRNTVKMLGEKKIHIFSFGVRCLSSNNHCVLGQDTLVFLVGLGQRDQWFLDQGSCSYDVAHHHHCANDVKHLECLT